jgi:hypothetical protein
MIDCNSDDLRLSTPTGTLFGSSLCPATPGPWPVVLLIAGSGPTDRNGNSPLLPGENNSLRLLAEALAVRGIASVRYDKRGIGASRGALARESDILFDIPVDDAAAGVRDLRSEPRFTTVTVVGHSEGSLVGILATSRASADAFVSIAGIGRPAWQVIHDQLTVQAPALVADADRIMERLASGVQVEDVPAALEVLFRKSVQPYLVSWFRYDPTIELRALSVPILIVQGTTDIQVTTDDARLLAGANPEATCVLIDGMNHVLKMVPADQAAQVRSYADPSLPIAPQLVESIIGFVLGVERH